MEIYQIYKQVKTFRKKVRQKEERITIFPPQFSNDLQIHE